MRQKPTVLAREIVASSRLFRVEEVQLRFSNGVERTYERLVGRGNGYGAVMIVAMIDAEHAILVEEYCGGTDEYEVSLPKGLIEPGEDVLAAAERELKEEAGFGARQLEHLTELSLSPGYMSQKIQVVLASDLYEAHLEGDDGRLQPGLAFDLCEHPRADFNDRWRSIALKHVGKQFSSLLEDAVGSEHGTEYHLQASAIRGEDEWKAPLCAKPCIDGPQIATVVGPPGEEIYCDEWGRVKVSFPWDRDSPQNDHSSCWSLVPTTQGDEAGTAKGIKSNTVGGMLKRLPTP